MCSPLPAVDSKSLTKISHMFFVNDKSKFSIDQNVDKFGDSFARDVSLEELRKVRLHNFQPQIRIADKGPRSSTQCPVNPIQPPQP